MNGTEFFGERAQQRVEKLTIALALAGATAALFWRGWPEGAGVLVGGIVAWINFRWLRRFVGWIAKISLAQSGQEKPRMPSRIFLQMFGRYVLLGLALYVMLMRFYWPVVAFVCGLFALVAAVLLEVLGEVVLATGRRMLA